MPTKQSGVPSAPAATCTKVAHRVTQSKHDYSFPGALAHSWLSETKEIVCLDVRIGVIHRNNGFGECGRRGIPRPAAKASSI